MLNELILKIFVILSNTFFLSNLKKVLIRNFLKSLTLLFENVYINAISDSVLK